MNSRIENVIDWIRSVLAIFFAVIAVIGLSGAIYQVWLDRTTQASILATIALVTTLLFYLPHLELLKAFGVEARMKKSIGAAEEIIGRLRRQAETAARATYLLIAHGNRYGGITPKDKQQIIDDFDEVLISNNVSKDEIDKLKGPYLALIGYDLKSIFERVMKDYVQSTQLDGAAKQKWLSASQSAGWLQLDQIKLMDGKKLRAALIGSIPALIAEQVDHDRFVQLAGKIGQLFTACLKRGGYTDETIEMLEKSRQILDTINVPTSANTLMAVDELLQLPS